MKKIIQKFIKNNKGVSAIEFAIALPVILVMYAGFVSLTTANKISGKVSQVASTVSDLLAQSTTLDLPTIDNVIRAGEAIAGSNIADEMTINVIGVEVDENQNANVVWSRNQNRTNPFQIGAAYPLPQTLKQNEGFIIASQARVTFMPTILPSYLAFVSVPIEYQFYFVPRRSLTTTCIEC